ncbi:hypothetical protein GCM10011505_45190 [Tistrella bauzanensis]|uniref:GIY-YIG nuclease family protein n=1 Tax=Tistrella bauzanensis TaxID=657419 RepID=A0ABQ1J3U4_9PROT|nr:GIY-YIG nuclease family protein [Tistrella bauzanensis]GGB59383.1 hypothetical protein GCM10011505_45190 [Tistrella bauzanensis]
MTGIDRKRAVAAYKERKGAYGIYVIRCVAGPDLPPHIWIGQTPTLDTIRNRIWFTLRQGTNPHRTLQDAWHRHGADSLAFEVLDRLEDEDDTPPYVRATRLKDRLAHWRAVLDAQVI